MPPQDRAGRDQPVHPQPPGQGQDQRARTAAVGPAVPVEHRRAGLAGQPFVSPADHHHEHLEQLEPLDGERVLIARRLGTRQGNVIEWLRSKGAQPARTSE